MSSAAVSWTLHVSGSKGKVQQVGSVSNAALNDESHVISFQIFRSFPHAQQGCNSVNNLGAAFVEAAAGERRHQLNTETESQKP